ncbi:lipoprotein [Couchioplanes caeruleus subsp. azureus]|nr:lipoprotein [Couchioplanes caeruleus subsp. azureus]
MSTSALSSVVLRRSLLAGAAVTATLVLSACGGDSTSSDSGMNHGGMTATSSAPVSASAGASTSNDADVTFAQSMIEHHRQAIEMAEMADGRAADAEVKDLATKVMAAQQPEIDTMTQWLTAWGKPTALPSMGGHGTDHSSMPGMMSEKDMAKMRDAKGAAFDKQFLTMMIAHHEGAVEMSQQETAQGSNPEAKALAQKIITDQQAEIATMKKILERL